MKTIIRILLLVVVLFTSCNSSSNTEPKPNQDVSKSFIQRFIFGNKFICQYNTAGDYIIMYQMGNNPSVTSGAEFDQLCADYNDVNYNKPISYGSHHEVFAEKFLSIDIVSDIDFDTEHPAGKSLSDITMFHAVSPYIYIQSGYKTLFDWKNNTPAGLINFTYEGEYHPVYKLVSELTPSDMLLLYFQFYLKFTKPRPAGKQTYTITLKTKDKTFESKVTIG